jgi:hypothetical protein
VSLEALSVAASIGTLLVIGATAIFAAIQLRHARAGNQIAGIMVFAQIQQSPEFQEARRFIRDELSERLRDPGFRAQFLEFPLGEAARPLLLVGNFYEELGILVKRGIIDAAIACDLWSAQVGGAWRQMSPAIAIIRRRQGDSVWENFEYLVTLSEQWFRRYPAGTLPKGRHRRSLEDVWLAEDTRIEKQGADVR